MSETASIERDAPALRVTPRGVIVVLAKLPRAGFVKTRMCPPLSPELAAELYTHMLADVLACTADLARECGLDALVAVHPPEGAEEVASQAPPDFRIVAQRGRDLAERMTALVAECAAWGAPHVLLRGSDSPVLGARQVEGAVDALREHDIALVPDLGGGYSLVGLRGPVPGLFDHPMSTSTVLDDTLSNARALGLTAALLDPSMDMNSIADLRLLARERASGTTSACPRTIAFLDEQSLWPAEG